MKIKRFFAKDMRGALAEVKRTLGPDAVIMSSKTVAGGVELVAAYEPEQLPQRHLDAVAHQETPAPTSGMAKQQAIADSLEALLKRQEHEALVASEAIPAPAAMVEARPAVAPKVSEGVPTIEEQEAAFMQEPIAQVAGQLVAEHKILNDSQVMAQLQAQDAQMETMRDDMAAIRALLEHQVSGLMWQEVERREPMRALLIRKLQNLGFSNQIADQISCFIPDGLQKNEAWQHTLDLIQNQIQTTNNDILQKGGVVALVGATGVGKTTTVAKLAARFARRHGPDSVAMVTTDTYRIAAAEQLQTYGRIIGCTVKVAKDADELNMVLAQLRQRKLVLIDTAGMSQRDMRLTEQLESLMRNSRLRIRPYLVLSATAQGAVQEEIVRRFQKLPLSGCIFTKLDECMSLGESLSVSMQHNLPISYLTDGQRVPEDIKVADAGDLIARAETLVATQVVSAPLYPEPEFAYA